MERSEEVSDNSPVYNRLSYNSRVQVSLSSMYGIINEKRGVESRGIFTTGWCYNK